MTRLKRFLVRKERGRYSIRVTRLNLIRPGPQFACGKVGDEI